MCLVFLSAKLLEIFKALEELSFSVLQSDTKKMFNIYFVRLSLAQANPLSLFTLCAGKTLNLEFYIQIHNHFMILLYDR